MSFSPGRQIFGIHSIVPYNRNDGTPYGALKVVKSSSLNLSGALIPLNGGSNKYPYAVEESKISSQLALKFSEYPDFVFQLFGGATPTENSADASGNVSTLTNKQGTSVMSATTGVASVLAISGSEGDLKFGKYLVLAKSATTVNVYALGDVDFGRGTSQVFQDSTLKLVASDVTITTGAASNITGFGFKLTGGSGAIALVVGDTATFEVRPKNSANAVLVLGQQGAVFPEFGAVIYAKKRGNGELAELDVPRMKGEGTPFGFDEDKWSECDVKAMIMYDSALDYIARLRFCTPLTPN